MSHVTLGVPRHGIGMIGGGVGVQQVTTEVPLQSRISAFNQIKLMLD